MSKVEIIEQLNGIVPKNPKSEWAKYQRSIVDEAIKELQQEPATKNDLDEAYNKGYADGVNSVNICPYCGEYIGEEKS